MGERITLKMIDGTLKEITRMSGLTFERHGNTVFNTTKGSHQSYVYGQTKQIIN